MFNSRAALSNSSSIGDAKSTFTRWIGPIICPAFVKKRETSFPWSARRAIDSADIRLFCLRVLFIQLLLLRSCLPQCHEASPLRRYLPWPQKRALIAFLLPSRRLCTVLAHGTSERGQCNKDA